MKRFTTERLIIEDMEEGDFAPLHRIYTQEENMRYVSSGKFDWTMQELKEKLARCNRECDKGIGLFAVKKKEGGRLLGEAGFFNSFNDLSVPELGYILDRSVWGKGYGSELCAGMIQYCFSVLHAREVVARMYAGHTASVRICEKCGMQRTGVGEERGRRFFEYRIKQ